MAPANGHKSSNYSTCGATVTFDCDQCYELEGPRELSCLENETWSGDEPTCTGQFIFVLNCAQLVRSEPVLVVKSCPGLATPDSGTKDTNKTACGSIVDFSCNECYELKGQKKLSCLPNETWSAEIPVCSRKCFCN